MSSREGKLFCNINRHYTFFPELDENEIFFKTFPLNEMNKFPRKVTILKIGDMIHEILTNGYIPHITLLIVAEA